MIIKGYIHALNLAPICSIIEQIHSEMTSDSLQTTVSLLKFERAILWSYWIRDLSK